MAWSDPSPNPRTSATIAEELHTLLANADIAGPYVLVAHSLSGKYARIFTTLYPNEVAGLVLIDARHEYMDEMTSSAERQAFYDAVDAQGRDYALARRLGVARLFGSSLAGTPSLPSETRSAMALLSTHAHAIAATRAEARARDANDAEPRARWHRRIFESERKIADFIVGKNARSGRFAEWLYVCSGIGNVTFEVAACEPE